MVLRHPKNDVRQDQQSIQLDMYAKRKGISRKEARFTERALCVRPCVQPPALPRT
jgi:hypothetical protein